jgi:hypothetical protein
MTMPGFAAEASVYCVKAHYRTTSVVGQVSRIGESVRLALRSPDPNCFSNCMGWCDPGWTPNCSEACHCSCSGGHNCKFG